jgi:hypothetical protein
MASTTIIFFGIRLEPSEDEIERLEDRSHPAILSARKAGLQYYWGNFGAPGESYLLFIGKLLGKLGVEDASELRFGTEQLSQIASEVSSKLSSAGFAEVPVLLSQFQPDE